MKQEHSKVFAFDAEEIAMKFFIQETCPKM